MPLIAPDGSVTPGEFLIWEESPQNAECVRLTVTFGDQALTRDADDFFTALRLIRSDLVAVGLTPRCYGSSRNVDPSSMSQSMGAGVWAYKLHPGQRGRTADLVDIFADGPDVDPVPVEVQEAYHREWLRSLGS